MRWPPYSQLLGKFIKDLKNANHLEESITGLEILSSAICKLFENQGNGMAIKTVHGFCVQLDPLEYKKNPFPHGQNNFI